MLTRLTYKFILTTLLCAAISGNAPRAAAQPNRQAMAATVVAKADSAQITMGTPIWLKVSVTKNSHEGVFADMPQMQPGKTYELSGVEIREFKTDSTALADGRIKLEYSFLVQPFEPGTVVFAPFRYVVDTDTFASDVTTLKVLEPRMPKEMVDSLRINPMRGTVSIPSSWYDYIPEWWPWALLAFLLISAIAAGIILYRLYKKNGPSILARKTVIPPYQLAMARLEKLKSRKLAENGHEKEYYTVLTDILRQYLEGRFNIYAREMSTSQIVAEISAKGTTAQYVKPISSVLNSADFVKFAKVRPLPDENVRAFNTVRTFIEETKPVEKPDPGKDAAKNAPPLTASTQNKK